MISKKLVDELNEQVKQEFLSANYYMAMAAHFASEGLEGMSQFFLVQAEEERSHAMKFFNYLNEIGQRVYITAYEEPKNEFASVKEVFETALKHEQFITSRIYKLMDLAKEENHYPTISFLQWFVDEQVEEEDTMNGILDKLDMVGEKGAGLYMLDKELGRRQG